MSRVQTSPHNQVDYFLDSPELGRFKGRSVIGWQGDLMEMARSKQNSGVVNKVSFGIEFFGGMADYLTRAKKLYISPSLTKFAQHPTKLKTVKVYDAFTDISEYKLKDKKVKIKARESSILMKLKSSKSKKIELETLEALDGTVLQPLQKEDLNILGQELLLTSEFELDQNNKSLVIDEVVASDAYGNRAVPMKLLGSDDVKVNAPSQLTIARLGQIYNTGTTGNMFYADNDREKTLNFAAPNINFDYSHINIPNAFEIRLDLVTYENGSNYDYKEHQTLAISTTLNSNITYATPFSKTILQGESLALSVHVYSDPHDVFLEFNKADFLFTENSTYPPSINKMVLPLEFIERMAQIITGRTDANLVYTEIFGRVDRGYEKDGELAYLSLANGFGIRGFDDKNITTSWKDLTDSLYAVKNVSYNVEKINGIETIVFEKMEYFYQNGKTFDFPLQAKNEEIEVYKKYQYNIIEVGYDKGGTDYEHAQGLNDPNGKLEYSSPFEGEENKFTIISKYNGDSTGVELARRQPKLLFPTTDTRYDSYIWFLDCKKVDGKFFFKTWQDIYETQPTGVFSPDTVANLDLTPMRNFQNHTWWVNGGLDRFLSKEVKCTPVIGNSELSTKKTGEAEIKESDNLKISTFQGSRFGDDLLKFDHKIDYEFKEILEGYTLIGNRKVPNFYFPFRLKREDGSIVKIRLLKVKPDKEGKIECLIIK